VTDNITLPVLFSSGNKFLSSETIQVSLKTLFPETFHFIKS